MSRKSTRIAEKSLTRSNEVHNPSVPLTARNIEKPNTSKITNSPARATQKGGNEIQQVEEGKEGQRARKKRKKNSTNTDPGVRRVRGKRADFDP
ncbi:hypothetical protein V5O48_014980 [Marasmius crinis-equi]|uniref:Uncharacterized protein n=1 Tax=Marasmius crinis-equi TaxID=585013 RepID=A0ABR3EVU2_9AGAR